MTKRIVIVTGALVFLAALVVGGLALTRDDGPPLPISRGEAIQIAIDEAGRSYGDEPDDIRTSRLRSDVDNDGSEDEVWDVRLAWGDGNSRGFLIDMESGDVLSSSAGAP